MKKPVLVVSNRPDVQASISRILSPHHQVDTADAIACGLELFHKNRYEFSFIDIDLLHHPENGTGKECRLEETLARFFDIYPAAELIVLTPRIFIRNAVEAVKAGASNYVTLPVDKGEIKLVIEKIQENRQKESEIDYFRDHFWSAESRDFVKTRSPRMRAVFDKVRSVAPTRTTVLIQGETGTGKGIVAKVIHHNSNRREHPFIAVHCGAIPETLLESELFGHEKGAFTGADRRKLGKFEIARGGTIFLDEIGTVSPAAQIKLLQVLQDRTFQRVGGETTIESDARVIAATNIPIREMMEAGRFRKDLFYRLNVFPIEIPRLLDRSEDIPMLADFFLHRFNKLHGKKYRDIHPKVLEAFARYNWPGNIRELENLMERACILETSNQLTPEGFPGELFAKALSFRDFAGLPTRTLAEVRSDVFREVEKNYLEKILAEHRGKINRTAEAAGIGPRQLRNLLKKHHLLKNEFKSP